MNCNRQNGSALVLPLLFAGVLIFCCFGMYMSIKQASVRSDRCAEVGGQRVSGKYNGSLCLLDGKIVDVDRFDYLNQASLIKEGGQ